MAKKYTSPSNHLYLVIAVLSLVIISLAFALNQSGGVRASDIMKKSELTKKNCETVGSPVINVTQKVKNSVDSGQAGNNWAFDDYQRQIRVWKQTDDTYCATVSFEGKFDAQVGQRSPGNTGILSGNEDGTFKGGYRAVISGSLLPNPSLPLKGNIGVVDYQCNLAGVCPGAYNWTTKYFNTSATGYVFQYSWWGWEYRYQDSVWINASDGNTGDVL